MSYIPYIDPDHYGNFFQIDDVSTPIDPAAEHFVISGYGTYGAPERDVEAVAVPGRNGDLIFDNGRFTNAEVYYDIGWARGFAGGYNFERGENNLAPFSTSAGSAILYNVTVTSDGNGNFTFERAYGAGGAGLIPFSLSFSLTRGTYFISAGGSAPLTLGLVNSTQYASERYVIDSVECSGGGGYVSVPADMTVELALVAYDGQAFDVTISPSVVTATAARNIYSGFDYFRGQLMSKSDTYYKLTDSYHPGEYRMARVARIEDLQLGALNDSGRCRIVFDCKPQRFVERGDTPKTLTNGTAAAVVLDTYYPSFPVIEITPTAVNYIDYITVTNDAVINGKTVSMSATVAWGNLVAYFVPEGKIEIDCGTRSAIYSIDMASGVNSAPGGIVQTTPAFPYLVPPNMGTNSVTVTITPRSGSVAADIAIKTKEYVI